MKSNIGYRTQNIEYSLMTTMIEVMSASETTESLWPLLVLKILKLHKT